MAVQGRDFLMHARIGVLRALNRNVERTFNPDRKDTHWGKRKLIGVLAALYFAVRWTERYYFPPDA
jgi:hypothetical protein